MATISQTYTFVAGAIPTAAQWNSNWTTVINAINGNLDADNVDTTAVATLATANTWTADQTFNDSVKVSLGSSGDADLYYDGTDVILNTAVLGTGDFVITGGSAEFDDSEGVTLGTGKDATIQYNGTDLVISPAVVGTGDVVVSGGSVEFDDSEGVTLGTGKDATLQYDGTNVVLTTDAVGSGVLVVSNSIRSDTDSTDDLGTTGVRWANLYVDDITVTTSVTAGGVITGATVEATGDTSAGDNAAMGYTATEGLILTGQGSTNDVTIKNDADTAVISIPTGGTGVTFAGTITASTGITSGGNIVSDTDSTDDLGTSPTRWARLYVDDIFTTNVVQGSTIEATGDTSAGDNSAMGYTSTEGLILTGQGSTNDVTIKNDADTTVFSIPTGTTNAHFAGDIAPQEFASQGISNFGAVTSASYNDTQTVTFEMNGGLFFTIVDANTGSSACFFANYNSATISELADPNNAFDVNTAVDGGKINVTKSANSQQISVTNNTGAAHSILIHTLGQVTTASGPS